MGGGGGAASLQTSFEGRLTEFVKVQGSASAGAQAADKKQETSRAGIDDEEADADFAEEPENDELASSRGSLSRIS